MTCFFCANNTNIEARPPWGSGPLCDNCRALLSDFLVWMGRKPLPPRGKVR
jgi:hypothetical protein